MTNLLTFYHKVLPELNVKTLSSKDHILYTQLYPSSVTHDPRVIRQ